MASRQHGVVSIAQLNAIGVTKDSVRRRVSSGKLHRIHRGVYAVGHSSLSHRGMWMAAALACGEGSVVSHRSAAELWRLLRPTGGPVEVSVAGYGGRSRRAGLRIHRRVAIRPEDVTRRYGIPVTRPAQTIVDLRGCVSPSQLRRAIRQASVLGLPLGPDIVADPTRSDLELFFLRLCRRHRLPTPEVNVFIGSHDVDFLWRDARLVVETDGYGFHRGRQAFEDDRARDLDLRTRGYDVLRFSYRQVIDEPDRIATVVRSVLEAPRAS